MDPITLAKLWLVVKPVKRIKERRAAKKAAAAAASVEGQFQYDEGASMEILKGAAKSKLVWLGLAQVAYGIVELWASGTLSAESVGPVLSGAITMWLRAVTTQSLAEKAK